MLCEVEEGCFHLEDLNAHVPIDLSQTVTTPGLFTENCIVLAEGQLVDGVFVVQQLGFPPPQQRLDSLDAVGGSWDLFRTGVTPAQWLKVQALEHAAADSMFVVVSDVHLDVPLVLDKLRAMLAGFCTVQPLPLFVLLGDFTARPVGFGKDGAAQLASHFKALANLIAEFPALASEGRFVLVPGPNDPGAGATLPRAPLASHFTAALRERVPHASFATNPCRLRFYAQEIVIFREVLPARPSPSFKAPRVRARALFRSLSTSHPKNPLGTLQFALRLFLDTPLFLNFPTGRAEKDDAALPVRAPEHSGRAHGRD
jgi:DNA polymerase epsilon subunit 2